MKLRTALALLGVLVGSSSQASAQVAELRPAPSVLFRAKPADRLEVDSLNIPPTHWKTGALIGGGAGALFGGYFGAEMCRYSETYEGSCVLSAIGGAAFFGLLAAIPGALIGGQFPKSE